MKIPQPEIKFIRCLGSISAQADLPRRQRDQE